MSESGFSDADFDTSDNEQKATALKFDAGPVLIESLAPSAYYADPCSGPSLNHSTAKTLLNDCPLLAWRYHPKLGGARRERSTEVEKKLSHGNVLDGLVTGFAPGSRPVVIKADNYRTKAAQAERDEAIAKGLPYLLEDEWDPLARKAEGVKALILDLIGPGYICQPSVFWKTEASDGTLVQCRARLDILSKDRRKVIDIKHSDVLQPRKLARHMLDLGYELQRAAYVEAIEKVTGVRPSFQTVFIPNKDTIDLALPVDHGDSFQQLGEMRWRAAVDLWHWCRKNGLWPGYGGTDNLATVHAERWMLEEAAELMAKSQMVLESSEDA